MSDHTKHTGDLPSPCGSVNEDTPSPSTAAQFFKSGSTSPSGTDSPATKGSPVLSHSESLDDAESQVSTLSPSTRRVRVLEKLANFDLRPKLPSWISRFLGYRKDGICRPILALRWLDTFNVPLVVEEYFFAGFCTISGLICVIAINTSTPFATLPIPLSLGFVGALAIILAVNPQSSVASPRNAILSHFFASMLATIIAKLFLSDLKDSILIAGQMNNQTVWVWACVSVTITVIFQKASSFVHPPAGATALIGTIHPAFIRIGWRYVGLVMSSVLCMIGVALFWGNLGRQSYPKFWFIAPDTPSNAFPDPSPRNHKDDDSQDSYFSSSQLSQESYQSSRSSKDSLTIDSGSNSDVNSEKSLSLSIRAS
ncbi:hypothetical protein PSHT_00155 [Puccinia striiformis]|uniref:HPP transmembrane region domain-containing protein n=1 Tax=Puccinia striiformis TaxID=27350 RepID=A0A2S4WP43_9BASI|nr:hypothetical protein PSHT_00155 [Puccinia striiformis]